MPDCKPFKLLLCLFCLSLVLAGCGSSAGDNVKEAENSYKIYYVSSSEDKLVAEDYTAKEEETNKLINELLRQLNNVPDGTALKKPIPDSVDLKSKSLKDGVLTLDFSESYHQLTGISEILRRASVVKTLCQIKEVKKVEYRVENQPLMYSELNPVGAMSADDFIDNTGGETTYYQTVQISLYYTNADGKKLYQTRHNVEFDGTISLEELVIRQLMAGPLDNDKLAPVMPPGTKLNKVTFKDGICYVDFSKEFLEGREGVSDEVIVYSVVNSLSEISSVTKVQFFIDGKPVSSYRETIPIDLPVERKLDIIAEN